MVLRGRNVESSGIEPQREVTQTSSRVELLPLALDLGH